MSDNHEPPGFPDAACPTMVYDPDNHDPDSCPFCDERNYVEIDGESRIQEIERIRIILQTQVIPSIEHIVELFRVYVIPVFEEVAKDLDNLKITNESE